MDTFFLLLLYFVFSLCLSFAIVLLFVVRKELERSLEELMKITFCLTLGPISKVS